MAFQVPQQPAQPFRFGGGLNYAFRYSANDDSRDEELGVTWDESDEAVAQARASRHYLPKFWKMMIHIFKRSPSDLFTWGLRIGEDEDEITRDLCELLTHELWNKDLALFRYCLQKAVYLRVRNHVEPFGFFRPEFLEPVLKVEKCLVDEEPREQDVAMANAVYDAWVTTASQMEISVAPFMWELKNIIKGTEVTGTEEEEKFFVLEKVDIFNMRKAADYLCDKGLYKMRTDMYYVCYIRTWSNQWPTLQPYSTEMLAECEKVVILNRRRARAMGRPDIPGNCHDVYTRIPYWNSEKCVDSRYREAMQEYGDLWTVGSAEQVQEQPGRPGKEEAGDEMETF
ncbi:uncharacterized protein F4812DRAFT_270832 [Daldinia caldariorum]|uniref:uncharacterized protein n=1 Tax=Daldinia caldariorum TaxID=326644 RepID=UPI002008D435|nr:uncharacterized protein F4812DRAFT_270832 [Daldinia caldariorum]KAI1470578.1 hypothetical protein F4812DRAFT_270832 [Daldinia caldariorum]